MRVFVTGATGFIGAALVAELLGAGHEVLGLIRSDAGARALAALGAGVHRGDLADLDDLRRGVDAADAVVHTAFDHDFSRFVANCEADRRVIEAIGDSLAGSTRPFVVTSAIAVVDVPAGRLATEADRPRASAVSPRAASEEAAAAVGERGVPVSVIRLSQVHDRAKQGLVTELVRTAREKGVSAFVGDGANRWPAAHLGDVVRLYRLALEKGDAGGVYHAVAEAGIPMRDIAEALAKALGVPATALAADEAAAHFGWLVKFAGLDMPASSDATRQRLGWHPSGPGMLDDLAALSVAE